MFTTLSPFLREFFLSNKKLRPIFYGCFKSLSLNTYVYVCVCIIALLLLDFNCRVERAQGIT